MVVSYPTEMPTGVQSALAPGPGRPEGEGVIGRHWPARLLAANVFLAMLAVPGAVRADTGAGIQPPGQDPASGAPVCTAWSATCSRAMLTILNHDRAAYNLSGLRLKERQSKGTGSCAGAYGHSTAMARTGTIWHSNSKYPHASFPRSICVPFRTAGENVGEDASGNLLDDLRELDTLMMKEPHSAATCGTTVNHACNILNPAFHYVGIGVYSADGTTWLTEDFTN